MMHKGLVAYYFPKALVNVGYDISAKEVPFLTLLRKKLAVLKKDFFPLLFPIYAAIKRIVN